MFSSLDLVRIVEKTRSTWHEEELEQQWPSVIRDRIYLVDQYARQYLNEYWARHNPPEALTYDTSRVSNLLKEISVGLLIELIEKIPGIPQRLENILAEEAWTTLYGFAGRIIEALGGKTTEKPPEGTLTEQTEAEIEAQEYEKTLWETWLFDNHRLSIAGYNLLPSPKRLELNLEYTLWREENGY